MWLIWYLAAWLLIAFGAGVFVGKGIKWCDTPEKPVKRRAF